MNALKFKLLIFGISIIVFILSGCSKQKKNSYYTYQIEERILNKMYNNPDSAISYINLALKQDSISYEHGDFLIAIYYYYIKNDFYSAEKKLEKLISYFEDRTPDGIEEDYLYTDVLVMMTKASTQLGNYSHAMHYAKIASEVCRTKKDNRRFTSAEMDSYIGYILSKMGNEKEGLTKINKAIAFTRTGNDGDAFRTRLNCLSKKLTILLDLDSCKCIKHICDTALSEIKQAETDTSIQKIYDSKEKANDFLQFYSGVFLAYKCAACAQLEQIDTTKALLKRCLDTDWGKEHRYTSNCLIYVYAKLGMEEDFNTAYDLSLENFQDDTVQLKMIKLLSGKALIAKKKNNVAEALLYNERLNKIQLLLFNKEISEQIVHNTTMYEISEKEKELKKMEILKKRVLISHIIILSIIILITIHWYYHRKKVKQLKAAYYALLEKRSAIDTNIKLFSSIDSEQNPDQPSIILFKRIIQEMEKSKPYLKEDFTINTLAGLLNTNVNYVSRAINFVNQKSFPQWLAEYRNQIALKALQDNPNLSINEVCILTGHNTRETFSRQFKTLNGMSFSEFKEQNKKTAKS